MFKRFVPFAHASSIYEIPFDFYKQLGIKTIIIDLDNTLDSYKVFLPTERAKNLVADIKEAGLVPVIVSNNKEKRVKLYADELSVEYISKARKPFAKKLKVFLKEKDLSTEDVVLVGDQMMTDVLAARGAHIRVILTEKIVKEDQLTTRFNRLFDRPIRKHLRKKGKLLEWRTIYGQD